MMYHILSTLTFGIALFTYELRFELFVGSSSITFDGVESVNYIVIYYFHVRVSNYLLKYQNYKFH